jgi:hypothetical protein
MRYVTYSYFPFTSYALFFSQQCFPPIFKKVLSSARALAANGLILSPFSYKTCFSSELFSGDPIYFLLGKAVTYIWVLMLVRPFEVWWCYQRWSNIIGGHRHRSWCRRYPTSDIDICHSDIGDKYVGLKTVIPISEVFRYRYQSPLRCPTFTKFFLTLAGFKPGPLEIVGEHYTIQLWFFSIRKAMSDIG